MKISPKTALNFSLAVILIYWLYQLFLATINKSLPSSFSEFAVRIAITKSIHLVSIVVLLRMERAGLQEMGINFKNWKKQLLIGLLWGFLLFLLLNIGLTNLLNIVFAKPATSGSILDYFSETRNLYIWLAIGIFGGGLVEELMRIFMLTRFQKRFGQPGLYIALTLSSLFFGLGHLYQGTGTAISTGISGLVFGIFYIKRKSAIEVITIHTISDVLAILGVYQLSGNH